MLTEIEKIIENLKEAKACISTEPDKTYLHITMAIIALEQQSEMKNKDKHIANDDENEQRKNALNKRMIELEAELQRFRELKAKNS